MKNIPAEVTIFYREYLLKLPALLADRALVSLYHTDTRDNIKIVDPFAAGSDHFGRLVGEALNLLAARDPRRRRRVDKEVRVIINQPSLSAAMYSRANRTCGLDIRCFFTLREEDTVKLIAAVLVHESTHGRLFALGIPYTQRNAGRVEKLCCDEARRFAARVGLIADKLLGPDTSGHANRTSAVRVFWKTLVQTLRRKPELEAVVWSDLAERSSVERESGNSSQ